MFMVCLSFFNSFSTLDCPLLKAILVLVILVRHNCHVCGKALICSSPQLFFFNSFFILDCPLLQAAFVVVVVVLVRHNYRACGKALICFFPSEMAGQAGNPVNHPISPHVVIYILLCFYSLHGILTNIAECYFCCL